MDDNAFAQMRGKNLENMMHGKKKKESSLPQGIIKPLGDEEEMMERRFSLDDAIEMVWYELWSGKLTWVLTVSNLIFFFFLQKKSSDIFSGSEQMFVYDTWRLDNDASVDNQ